MMENLRAAANHTVLKIILGLIVVAFTLSGVGGYLISGHSDYAVKVNGQEISRMAYEHALNNQRNLLQQQLGDNYSQLAGDANYMKQVREQVMQQLVNQALLEQYIAHLKLDVSDEQIKQAIFREPAFQIDNKFSNTRYNEILRQSGLTAEEYAQSLRTSLASQQLISALGDTNFTLNAQTDAIASLLAQKRDVREATINVADLAKGEKVNDAEITTYYTSNQNQFTAAEQFRVDYIELDATDQQTSVSQADVEHYYQQHQSDFTAPEQRRYSVIQSKTEDDAKAVLAALKKGDDFATLAKDKSTDIISARNGGDMGWLTEQTTPDELKNAGLTEKGQLSDVIKSSVGYLVARLDDIRPAQIQPLSEVQAGLTDKLKQEKSLNAWYALQQKVSDAASNDNSSLSEAARLAGVKVQQTDWFTRDTLPKALDMKEVKEAIFNSGLLDSNGKASGNSDIITVPGDRAFVVRIADHKPQTVQPLDQVRDRVITLLKQQKAQIQALQQAKSLISQLQADSDKGQAALSAAGLAFGDRQTLSRDDHQPLTRSVFSLAPPEKGKISYGTGEDAQGNVVLLALDAVHSGQMSDEQKKALNQAMTDNDTQHVFDALLTDLRNAASIKINPAIAQ